MSASTNKGHAGRPSGLAWKLNRLRTMGAAELAWRLQQALASRLEAIGVGRIPARVPAGSPGARRWLPAWPQQVDRSAIVGRADAVHAGRFDVFALEGAPLGFPPDWHRDPRTGTTAPLGFGKRLDYRNPTLVGDIKYLWEPSRHLEIVTLAQAHVLTSDTQYAVGARVLLESWFDQCPYPLGVHWTSSLELAVRLLNWSVAWQMLESTGWLGAPGQERFARRWLGEIYRHQRFVAGHLSRHSSANNHLFGEYTGLFVATVTWPLWPESVRWAHIARAGLESEALLQTAPDGVNREQGLWYHHEVADMMLLTLVASRATEALSDAYRDRLERMLMFVASLVDVGGNVPMIGDSDDAVMVRFDPSTRFDAYRSLLAAGAVLFSEPALAAKAERFDDKCRWLLGDSAETTFDQVKRVPPAQGSLPRAFTEGGYWILGDRIGEPDELKAVVDAGPLGYLSIAAHGHADALSFTLSAHGREVLIDSGTFAYHTHRRWRDYFKGTSAHNTVRVDGEDQSISGGNFMWLRHAQAHCEEFSSSPAMDRFVGVHDGYMRLAAPVLHRRAITLHKSERRLEVSDSLVGEGDHDVELFWHFAEACHPRLERGVVVVENGPLTIRLQVTSDALRAELIRGRDDPPLGWVSRRFDRKQAIWCARWHGRVPAGTAWTTLFEIEMSPRPPAGEGRTKGMAVS